MHYKQVPVSERLPQLMKWVTTIDEANEHRVYRRTEYGWNMRDTDGTNSPNNNIPITHWLEEVDMTDTEEKAKCWEMVYSIYSLIKFGKMQKGAILVGPKGSGKTTSARIFASNYLEQNVTWMHTAKPDLNSFDFGACHQQTKLIVVEEVPDLETLRFWFNIVADGIIVHKKGFENFRISPEIIVTSNAITKKELIDLGEWFSKRFDIIECTHSTDPKEWY